jgi:hypothetical protein
MHLVVPVRRASDRRPHLGCKAESARGNNLRGNEGGTKEQHRAAPGRATYCWAEMMRRVLSRRAVWEGCAQEIPRR